MKTVFYTLVLMVFSFWCYGNEPVNHDQRLELKLENVFQNPQILLSSKLLSPSLSSSSRQSCLKNCSSEILECQSQCGKDENCYDFCERQNEKCVQFCGGDYL